MVLLMMCAAPPSEPEPSSVYPAGWVSGSVKLNCGMFKNAMIAVLGLVVEKAGMVMLVEVASFSNAVAMLIGFTRSAPVT